MCDSETCAGEPEKRQAEQLTLEAEFNKYFTVFDGSSPEDVSHAKQLWTSLSLLPLLESRLISADISQRLPVAKTNHESTTAVRPSSSDLRQRLQEGSHWKLRQEEKQRYMDMAKQRLEIISLLHQQRQNRIQKETVSLPYKPRHRDKSQRLVVCPPKDLETDVEEVQKLQ
ncbi:UPF0722 protein C11orf88 homolog isoform X7 [Esox lucius]|uniref:Cilia- and flagella-associated protein HOATZ n=1 Tax=Esox lucius TaxID=8010 RepID=A0A3P8Y2K7_ESOLU|nr:UPF0722 protein C11orf88 homolog isoform X7 [Esox lucius]